MDAMLLREVAKAQDAFRPFERIEGALDCGALVICDHAANAIPPGYGGLGLPREALERHIAYDIGAAELARRLAARLGAPAILSTFSRLLIDPNRGPDDPTLVMRISDGAVVPGNARIGAQEIERRRRLFWAPYRAAIEETLEAMLATGEPPAILSVHSFTPSWRGCGAALEGRRPLGLRPAPARASCCARWRRKRTSGQTKSATTSPTRAPWRATPSTPSRPRAASPTRSSRCGRI